MLTVKSIITKNLWVSAAITFIAILIIPIGLSFQGSSSITMPKGVYVKKGNRIFYNFLEQLKQEKGILVLGTSETGNQLDGNNYFSILNKDKEFNKPVYAFGGAGRAANVYFPLILDNPKAFENLELIYYINPTYWRNGLNKFSEDYFKRYVDDGLAFSVKNKAQRSAIYNKFIKDGAEIKSYFPFITERITDNFKSFYYHNLTNLIANKIPIKSSKIDIKNFYNDQKLKGFKQKINLEYNVTDEFLKKNSPFPAIDTSSSYQYELLYNFIKLTKQYNINCTFYLGPYNEIYCNQQSPELKKEHQKVVRNIRQLLIKNDAVFIDGSAQSTIPGTFTDIQHISEYGAYLTAIQIKEYYEKNN